MELDEGWISHLDLRELATTTSLPGGISHRAVELSDLLAASGSTLKVLRVEFAQIHYVYTRRLRLQQKRNRTITPGLPEFVAELAGLKSSYVWMAVYELGDFTGHIFITRDPDQLVGITTAPRRRHD